MTTLLRAVLVLCVLAPASGALGQDADPDGAPTDPGADEAPLETTDGADEDPYAEGPTDGGDAEGEPAEGEPVEGEAPQTATSSVVVDERAAELQREQLAMQDEAEAEEQDPSEDEEEDAELSHLYQVGIRAGIGVPFFFGIRYGGGPPCDATGDTFCFFLGSGFIDLDVSFGVTEDLEITALGRIGLVGSQPTDENRLLFGLGIRSLLMPRDIAKLYLGVRLILDATGQGNPPTPEWSTVDFGVRGEFGLQVDLFRYMGIYAQIGVNILFLRAFGIQPDISGGLQARFP